MTNSTNGVLLLTQDSTLVAEVLRLTQAIGMDVVVEDNPLRGHRHWSSAAYVLVGDDLAAECADAGYPKRDGIAIIHSDRDASPEVSEWERGLWKCAVSLSAENVVGLPSAQFWLDQKLSHVAPIDLGAGTLIAVMPGSGGAGSSTFAVNLGMRAVSKGESVLLIDADPLGAGIDLTLGSEEIAGARWCDIDPGAGRIAADTLKSALPRFQGIAFLSHGRLRVEDSDHDLLGAVIEAGRRAFDLVIVDLPRAQTPVVELVVDQAALTVISVRNHVRAVAASARTREWIRTLNGNPQFIVTSDHKGVGASDIAHALGVSDLCEVPFIPSIGTRADEGEFPTMTSAYAAACDRVLAWVTREPLNRAA